MANYEIIKDRAKTLLNVKKDSRIYSCLESYAWYNNNKDAIKAQIQERLWRSVIHDRREIKRKIKSYPYINKIPKTLGRLCSLYKDSPIRYVKNGKCEIDPGLTDAYNKIVKEVDLNGEMKKNHRLATFYNTVIVGPYFEEGKLFIKTYLPFEYLIIPKAKDKNRIDALLILNIDEVSPQEYKKSVIVWTEKDHYVIDQELISMPVEGNPNKLNPYDGVIPFLPLRINKDDYDPQGYGLEWMVEIFLAASTNRTYANYLIPYSVGGILVAKNIDLGKAVNGNQRAELPGDRITASDGQEVIMNEQYSGQGIRISPDLVLSLKPSTISGKDASIEFVSLKSDMSVVRTESDWDAKNALSDAGVDLNSIVLERGYTSGFGIVAESQGLMELRKEQIPILAKFENDLFNLVRSLGKKEPDVDDIPDDAELFIDYKEPSFPRTMEETKTERDMKLQHNTISYLDLIREDNPDISSDEEAQDRLNENYKINKKFQSVFGNITDSILSDDVAEVSGGGKGKGGQTELFVPGAGRDIDMPTDRQFSYWDCGDSAVITALAMIGEEPNPDELAKDLGSTPEWGTEPENIKAVLEKYGYTVDLKSMSTYEVKEYLDKGIPVILDIQAWHFDTVKDYDYSNEWEDGHYVTAYGYNNEVVKLKDPSSLRNREITWDDLEKRWHDVDRKGNKLFNIGIAYYGLPITFSSTKTEPIG